MYRWSNGDVYTGQWKNGKMDGRGTKRMADGSVYDGYWKDDMADGHGTKTFEGGDSHTGEYKDDHRHGYGVYSWANGDKFEGNWFMGEQQGQGTYYYANEDVYKGEWFEGRKHGRGVFTTGTMSYEEEWDHGARVYRSETRFHPQRLMGTKKQDALLEEKNKLLDEVGLCAQPKHRSISLSVFSRLSTYLLFLLLAYIRLSDCVPS